jgi:serine/threonine protein kinase/tetratricopeptide (TPR) repeat protein
MIGQTLGHYRIEEKIGAGGMGEVYRAHDQHLDRDVALKVLPAGALADNAARKRLHQEAQALSKLSHPNIATIFDFDTQLGVDFLAMEMIPGATLSSTLAAGPFAEGEVLKLGMQLADALAAAHARGIVHRDLKPGNLIVSPEGRLKILDFGLATLLKPTGEANVTRTVTEMHCVSGTLPYMSPEQLRGEPADARSDIYSAGTVLYEMATGQRPFPQSQGAELIGAILYQTPSLPSEHNRLITPALEGVVMKALEKASARRYQTARELLTALESAGGLTHETVGARRMISRPRRWRWALASLGVLLIVGVIYSLNVGGLRDRLRRGSATGPSFRPSPIKTRRSVAVLSFKNLSGRPDESWLSTALAEMLTTELAAGEQLRLIPGENVAQMKVSLSLPEEDTYSKATLNRIRKNVGTDNVVVGSYLALGNGQVRVDLRLQDASSGETLTSVADSGKEAEVSDLAARVGEKLREKLGAGSVTTADAGSVRASLPSNPEAARLYSEGLAKLRVLDALNARDFLEKAVIVDPNYALAHSALAGALAILGYDAKAKGEAKRAFELSENLSREDRLMIEGRYRETVTEWDKAVEIYQTLWRFFPDNLDYGVRLASAQTSAGKGKEALGTVDAMRKLPSPAKEDPRIDQTEANAAESLGDFKRQQSVAAIAAEKARQQGAKLFEARALYSEGWAFQNLGQFKEAMQVADESKRIYSATGDRPGVGRVLGLTGAALLKQGDVPGALRAYQDSLDVSRETGSRHGMSVALNNIADILLLRGDLSGAGKQFEQARSIFHEIGDKDYEGYALSNIANVFLLRGEWASTVTSSEKALALFREIGDKDGQAYALVATGSAFAQQGNLAAAKKSFDESLMFSRETSDKSIIGYALYGLAGVLLLQGDLAEARKQCLESLKIRDEIGEKASAAESRVALAELEMEEGQPREAEMSARRAIEEFRTEKLADDEFVAQAVLVRALLAQGKIAEAEKEIDRLASPASGSQNAEARLKFRIAAARARAAMPRNADARKDLEGVLVEATRLGLSQYQFEARLALGEMEMKSKETAAGRAHLAALEKDATATGFLLIARKAGAAQR